MSDQHYREALRLGQKEYRACQSRGESPYLPVLETGARRALYLL